ncbi:YebC/PmpR family DNA-binding transcriptional regulator [Patescibacteria group bacterium]|nr:MAG: YebC/PmpR family DNA-binding transcriptional regulator [Patescibacteria group bacterium]
MSGHSHWAGIKHRKGINDAKRGKIFTKYGKLISIAARDGGGGKPETNFKLKLAIEQARYVNMPKENIDRAIKRGTGELKGDLIEEITYEAYGPGQVAMLIKTATDKKNRTLGELKLILDNAGGKLVSAGSVSFLFKQVGVITAAVAEGADPYELEMKAIEAGAEDTAYTEGTLTVYTKVEELQKVKESLEKVGMEIQGAGLGFIPLQKTTLSQDDQIDYEKLLETLDEQDDVQEIYDNL